VICKLDKLNLLTTKDLDVELHSLHSLFVRDQNNIQTIKDDCIYCWKIEEKKNKFVTIADVLDKPY